MSTQVLEVLEPGMLTTVQDRGRYGYQRFGVPVSGGMDQFALRAANLLVGNDDGAACLELTVLGPRVRFLADTWIALTGADLAPQLNGQPLPRWQSVRVARDDVLSFGGAQDGMRAYLAVAGGLDVPVVMGSRSTYVKAGIGGFQGRALKAGDVLSALPPRSGFAERKLPAGVEPPVYGHEYEVRVVLGPQDSAFTREGIKTFLESRYVVSIQSDRMGYRLEGPPIQHVKGPDIVSDGTPLGAVQVPGNRLPIVLLADRGTTGGYTKIATVISVDISKLAQAMPGDSVRFRVVTLEQAHAILREQEAVLDAIRRQGAPEGGPLRVLVNGEAFEVVDESGSVLATREARGGTGASVSSHRARATIAGQSFEFDIEVQERSTQNG